MEVNLDRIRLLIGALTLENLALREELERRSEIPVEHLGPEASQAVIARLEQALQKEGEST